VHVSEKNRSNAPRRRMVSREPSVYRLATPAG
jgi:hypothetical protein